MTGGDRRVEAWTRQRLRVITPPYRRPPYWTCWTPWWEERGRVAAAQALGVNYRTMTNCHDSRRVSRRMRQALEKFRDEQDAGGSQDGTAVDGEGETEAEMEALARRVAALEEENRRLREMVEAQGNPSKPKERSGDSVEERERRTGERKSGWRW